MTCCGATYVGGAGHPCPRVPGKVGPRVDLARLTEQLALAQGMGRSGGRVQLTPGPLCVASPFQLSSFLFWGLGF